MCCSFDTYKTSTIIKRDKRQQIYWSSQQCLPPQLSLSPISLSSQLTVSCFQLRLRFPQMSPFVGPSLPMLSVRVCDGEAQWGRWRSLLRASPLGPWRIPSKEWAHVLFRNSLCSWLTRHAGKRGLGGFGNLRWLIVSPAKLQRASWK